MFNGSSDSYLANYNLATGTWTQQTTTGWGELGNISFGAVGAYGKYVFASNTLPSDGGILRFDTTGTTINHFGPMASIINLSVDAKGIVYALDGQNVYEYNGSTLAFLGKVSVGTEDNRAVAAAADGTLYVASWTGDIQHFSATGTLLGTLSIAGDNFESIAINDATGQIALGTGFSGQVVLTDLALDKFTSFVATDNSNSAARPSSRGWSTPRQRPSRRRSRCSVSRPRCSRAGRVCVPLGDGSLDETMHEHSKRLDSTDRAMAVYIRAAGKTFEAWFGARYDRHDPGSGDGAKPPAPLTRVPAAFATRRMPRQRASRRSPRGSVRTRPGE